MSFIDTKPREQKTKERWHKFNSAQHQDICWVWYFKVKSECESQSETKSESGKFDWSQTFCVGELQGNVLLFTDCGVDGYWNSVVHAAVTER